MSSIRDRTHLLFHRNQDYIHVLKILWRVFF